MLLLHGARARRVLAVGILDAGFASLATFAVSLYAVRFLDPELLGAYALFFTVFIFAATVPAALYLFPVRIASIGSEQSARLGILPRSLAVGALLGAATAIWTPLAGVFALGDVSVIDIAPLALTAAALVVVSPLQDHLRWTFHLSGLSQRTVYVSALQLSTILVSIFLLHISGVPKQWIPFGSLVIANCASLSLGLLLASHCFSIHSGLPSSRSLLRSGWSLFLISIIPLTARFASTAAVAALTSVETVGYAEAARVVASPIHVAALGMWQVLSPGLMEAGRVRSRPRAVRLRLSFLLALLPVSGFYLFLVGEPTIINPMEDLVPAAYHLQGLVVLAIAAILMVDIGFIPQSEIAGAQEANRLVLPAVCGSIVEVGLVGAAVWSLGAYTLPLSICVGHLITNAIAFRYADRLYAEPSVDFPRT